MNEKKSIDKLLLFQQELQAEEDCLKRIIAKLNAQAHALQVEKLHILNAINKNETPKQQSETQRKVKQEAVDTEVELNLTVPTYQSSEEDEDEMED